MPTPGQRTATLSVRCAPPGQPLLSPCSMVYTMPCPGSLASSKLTLTLRPPPHCPTAQQLLWRARGRRCASSAEQPLPQVCVRTSRQLLGQLFSSPLREQDTFEGAGGHQCPACDYGRRLCMDGAPQAGQAPSTPAPCCRRTGTRRSRTPNPVSEPQFASRSSTLPALAAPDRGWEESAHPGWLVRSPLARVQARRACGGDRGGCVHGAADGAGCIALLRAAPARCTHLERIHILGAHLCAARRRVRCALDEGWRAGPADSRSRVRTGPDWYRNMQFLAFSAMLLGSMLTLGSKGDVKVAASQLRATRAASKPATRRMPRALRRAAAATRARSTGRCTIREGR